MPQPIVFILDSFSGASAGTESQLLLLLRELDRSRFEPRVALLRGPDLLSEHLRDVPVEILDIWQIRSLSSWLRAWRYARRFRKDGVRVAQIFFNDASVLFPLPLRLAGIRVAIARRDLGFWYTPGLLKLLRFSGRFVDAVVCNARAVQDVVIAEERIPAERALVIHNGIVREVVEMDREDWRRQMGLPTQALLLAIVANLRPLKRFDTAVRAIARLSDCKPAPHLVIAGADRRGDKGASHQAEIEALAQELGVLERVHFIGAVSDPMPVLVGCDAALLCSETEGLSNSVIEYMLAGKPVLCTPVGGNSELVEEGETGYFFEVGDDAGLAAKLRLLLENPALARTIGERAAVSARARFGVRRMVSSYAALYERLGATARGHSSPNATVDGASAVD
jgi:glycosyltransferase involved in cell wall biosynthesis